ncbi:MAG: trehalose-phosphatase [Burkholderiales bacterium]|nr:trehalose-phosphatase [Burkholderiales bacterium]
MAHLSLFLDLDGTLIDIAGHPDTVSVPAILPQILQRLDQRLGGALAIASGRNISVLDQLLFPYQGAAIGVHGLEYRAQGGRIQLNPLVTSTVTLRHEVANIARHYSGAFIEDKGSAIAVHERGTEAAAVSLAEALNDLCARLASGWHCLPGRRVVEIKPIGVDKGTGLESAMRQPPFSGTRPVVIGDDITDLDMFAAATRLGGLTMAVGDRITDDAHLHLQSPAAVLRFLDCWSTSDKADNLADIEALAHEVAAA